ncbi:MAG TPA: RhuM family protein [Thermoanaerobaculia bacterium]
MSEEATCKNSLQVRREGTGVVRRSLKHYNLEAILALGYRVLSFRGTQFRGEAGVLKILETAVRDVKKVKKSRSRRMRAWRSRA